MPETKAKPLGQPRRIRQYTVRVDKLGNRVTTRYKRPEPEYPMMRVFLHVSLRKRIKDAAQLGDITISQVIADCVDKQFDATVEKQNYETELGRLRAENARLNAENAEKNKEDVKLKTILEKLECLPAQTAQVVNKLQGTLVKEPEEISEPEVPMYIPTINRPKVSFSRINLKETQSDGANVTSATKALSKLRAKMKKD